TTSASDTSFPSGSSDAVTTASGSPAKATFSFTVSNPTDGNHYSTTKATSSSSGTSGTQSGAFTVNTGTTYSLADAFGNSVDLSTVSASFTITLTALSGGGFFDAAGLPSVITCTKGGNWKSTSAGADLTGYI